MEGLDITAIRFTGVQGLPPLASEGGSLPLRDRLRVDGKFFASGTQRIRLHGVTYGPFVADADGIPFPSVPRMIRDFAEMRMLGINSIRTYHLPPEGLLRLAEKHEIGVFLDVPWSKHLCFLDSAGAEREARELVRQAAKRGRKHPCVLAYSIGNEIPSNIIRWHGARHVERFLAELRDVCKQADPEGLVTYANYPSTEYLDLSFLDFATFNVYLHDREAFRRYLLRLNHLIGDMPLLLGEVGLDTLRHGELAQARFLADQVRDALLFGVAGTFVFSWTDDWHTGGHSIQDWAFGITYADRLPKAACHALREVFESTPAALLSRTPRVSVVVCSYNGGRTLEQCLRSLLALDYPDYEIIVVDDGSTDNTREILARFPKVRAIHQPNLGLSAARNAGLQAATGEIIAYTDSDCFADPDWLTHLVYQFERTDAAAVGGPNLTPEDGWLTGCVAAAPGQPMQVLENDQVAEHIPGCNMAFRRGALVAINGFDPIYRKAGDDVDICWRLQQAGDWITFAPGAFVWHHRRQNPRAYFGQQAGYGEAEALLRFKHPAKFNGRGDGKWQGALYGNSLQGLRLSEALIYRGTFGTGLFQCIYQPAPAHWAMLPSTLEWHLLAVIVALAGFFWPWAWVGVAAMVVASFAVAGLQAAQARVSERYDGWGARLLVTWLCYAQPLVRSWWRYWTRLFAYRPPVAAPAAQGSPGKPLPLTGVQTLVYWSEAGLGRLELLKRVLVTLNEDRWGRTLDSGWSDWDLEIYCHPWTIVQVCTAEEDHGGKHLIRVRLGLRASTYLRTLGWGAVLAGIVAVGFQWWPAAVAVGTLMMGCLGVWWRGTYRAAHARALFDTAAHQLQYTPCASSAPRHRGAPHRKRRRSWFAKRNGEATKEARR
jgi:GT2 family glycosyltransferase